MERPIKLMQAAVSQPLQICNESRKLLFSDLPDNVVHHIISFLDLQSLFRFIYASKRFRELYLTNPFLAFDGTEYSTCYMLQHMYMNLFNRFLLERNGRKLCGFLIRLQYKTVEVYRIITWLLVAVECNVEVVDLEVFCEERAERQKIEFPLCLFRCGSLRSVAVNLHGGFLVLPSSCGFSFLQSLSLKSVKMANNFGEWISSFCECLQELWLEDITEIDNVSIISSSLLRFTLVESRLSSQLRHLRIAGGKLEVVDITWRFNSSIGKSLKISAPNLKYLTWNGNPTNENCLDPFVQLEGARLLLEPKEDTANNLHEILLDVSRAKDLSLHDVMIKALFEQGYPFPPINNVQGLCMYTSSLNNDLVPAMIFLLTGMPNLKTVSIKSSALLPNTNVSRRVHCSTRSCASSPYYGASKRMQKEIKWSTQSINNASRFNARHHCSTKSGASLTRCGVHCGIKLSTPSANNASGFDTRYWESQNLRFICHLEMVELELFDGINALCLGLFLLKHAKKLKKMVVFHSPSLPSDTYRKIQNCAMATAATVVFQEK
ncbi:hypothetical protein Vadar_022267 [Vaccinium darrowii]|uniref:Uncharacterized protein n=1 Tax=Vaccinium darrowii TaxID=229202 RepID=A0ACB7Y8J2_9ERIC|nr:hypothetical protein Vadar_022267 [Vaccinium darrowii]